MRLKWSACSRGLSEVAPAGYTRVFADSFTTDRIRRPTSNPNLQLAHREGSGIWQSSPLYNGKVAGQKLDSSTTFYPYRFGPIAKKYPTHWVDQGNLVMKAMPMPADVAAMCDGAIILGAQMNTRDSLRFGKGCRVRFRKRMAAGSSVWDSAWTGDYAGDHRELDIEYIATHPTCFHAGLHSADIDPVTYARTNCIDTPEHFVECGVDLTRAFHDYDIEWDDKVFRWYFDGKPVHEIPVPASFEGRLLYLMINLSIGGGWGLKSVWGQTYSKYDSVELFAKPGGVYVVCEGAG